MKYVELCLFLLVNNAFLFAYSIGVIDCRFRLPFFPVTTTLLKNPPVIYILLFISDGELHIQVRDHNQDKAPTIKYLAPLGISSFHAKNASFRTQTCEESTPRNQRGVWLSLGPSLRSPHHPTEIIVPVGQFANSVTSHSCRVYGMRVDDALHVQLILLCNFMVKFQ